MKKTLAALTLCAAVVSPAYASIVDHGDYLTDTITGLDWLDVTKSVNKSFDYVNTQFGAGGEFAGWRYATGKEFNALIGSFTGSTPPHYGTVDHADDQIDGLVALLGSTLNAFMQFHHGMTWNEYYGYPEEFSIEYSYGFIADASPSGYQYLAIIDDYDFDPTMKDFSSPHYDAFSPSFSDYSIGSYLVRGGETHLNNPIPEPSSLALLGLGLLGFAANRRKAKSH